MRLVCEGSFTTESAAEQDYATGDCTQWTVTRYGCGTTNTDYYSDDDLPSWYFWTDAHNYWHWWESAPCTTNGGLLCSGYAVTNLIANCTTYTDYDSHLESITGTNISNQILFDELTTGQLLGGLDNSITGE